MKIESTYIDMIQKMEFSDYLNFLQSMANKSIAESDFLDSESFEMRKKIALSAVICIRDMAYQKFVVSEKLIQILELCDIPKTFERMRMPFGSILVGSYLINEVTITDPLSGDVDRYINVTHFDNSTGLNTIIFNEQNFLEVSKTIPFIVKLCYYLNSEFPDIERPVYSGKMLNKINSCKSARVVYVGRKYRSIKGVPTGIKMDKRFIVRGHWRKQPTKSGVKTIFIEPFYKCNDSANELIKKYVL